MNVKFKIFGTPDGFDLYQGTEDEINYFQAFNDSSKENTKLVIRCSSNGVVSYSYLKYGLVSCENRRCAFFGMSVLFEDEHCKEIKHIYELFEYIYYHKILAKNILVEEIKENQTKFLIHRFEEQKEKIKNIENYILVEIKEHFVVDPLDPSFKQNKPDLIREININKDNDTILKALKTYSLVAISPEYPENDFDEISKEGNNIIEGEIVGTIIEENQRKPRPLTRKERILWLVCTAIAIIIFIYLFIWILLKKWM